MTTTTETEKRNGKTIHALAGKYFTFNLGTESYGIDVLKVREIICLTTVTAVPQMPRYVRGVINLRGKIIPVMDLRLCFEFPEAVQNEQTGIVVVQVTLPDGKVTSMGLVVDGVEEVVSISVADIEVSPEFGGTIYADYIVGIAKIQGAVKVLLDINEVIRVDPMKKLKLTTA
jgi:purine-binding chemotaxis protein CheW